jgi:hypothetical protein
MIAGRGNPLAREAQALPRLCSAPKSAFANDGTNHFQFPHRAIVVPFTDWAPKLARQGGNCCHHVWSSSRFKRATTSGRGYSVIGICNSRS